MEESNNTAKTHLETVDRILDEYETKIGLPAFTPESSDQVKEYMNYSRDVLERLTPDQCIEISIAMNGFSFHLQRCKNRDEARIIWAEGKMRVAATPRISQYRAGSFSQNFDSAVFDDEYTAKLFEIRNWAAIRAKRFDYLSNLIKDKAESFKELARTKRNKNG